MSTAAANAGGWNVATTAAAAVPGGGSAPTVYTFAAGGPVRNVAAAADTGGTNGFIAVRELPSLALAPASVSLVRLPDDTFRHSTQSGDLQLTARLADGSPLPGWAVFDAKAGTFTLTPPAGLTADVQVVVTARDRDGKTASTELPLSVR